MTDAVVRMPMQDSLNAKVVIVTGSSRGIGKAIAICFSEAGSRVVVNYRRSVDSASDVARLIEANNPGGSLLIQADVTRERDVEAMVKETIQKFGRIDILVNNAGIIDQRSFLEISLDEWNRLIEGNLTNAFLCCKAVLPHMVRQKWGRIINISSTSGLTGGTSGAHYAAAKAGIVGLTKALSSEFAPRGITVNAIVPSKIETEMLWRSLDDKGKEALMKKIPVGRFGKPEEIGCLALFLASERAGYITGETIVASGGYR